mmetsp:Transcript_40627/g.101615  ORF Transcript_40627/g.101615 Transcript_40627/m.101615 type:complete len:265 (+) Transcript_40627:493-1287(+)
MSPQICKGCSRCVGPPRSSSHQCTDSTPSTNSDERHQVGLRVARRAAKRAVRVSCLRGGHSGHLWRPSYSTGSCPAAVWPRVSRHTHMSVPCSQGRTRPRGSGSSRMTPSRGRGSASPRLSTVTSSSSGRKQDTHSKNSSFRKRAVCGCHWTPRGGRGGTHTSSTDTAPQPLWAYSRKGQGTPTQTTMTSCTGACPSCRPLGRSHCPRQTIPIPHWQGLGDARETAETGMETAITTTTTTITTTTTTAMAMAMAPTEPQEQVAD